MGAALGFLGGFWLIYDLLCRTVGRRPGQDALLGALVFAVVVLAVATMLFVQRAHGAQALESFVERIGLDAPEGEPLRLELEAFVRAVSGDAPVPVSGDDGREALAVALTIVRDIERTMPSLAGTVARGRA